MRELEKIKAPTGCPHIPQLATTTAGATIDWHGAADATPTNREKAASDARQKQHQHGQKYRQQHGARAHWHSKPAKKSTLQVGS